MAAINTQEATDRLLQAVANANPHVRQVVYDELFPEQVETSVPPDDLLHYLQFDLAPEEIVALWNIMYPRDRKVYYNEETQMIHFNEATMNYAEG